MEIKKMLEKELENAKEIIHWDCFRVFVYGYHNEYIGFKKVNGRIIPTSLSEEIAEVGRLLNKADVHVGVNMYKSRQAYNNAEIEDPVARAERSWNRALNKILWLNTQCREYTGESFLRSRIDRENVAEARRLVEAFEFCILHPEMMNQ